LGVRRLAGNVLTFLLFFLSFIWLSSALLPYPFSSTVEEKFSIFREKKDDYDVVFVGSSLILRQIIPATVDEELARRGRPLRSFNFGIGGAEAHEINVLIDRILALEPARLKTIVIDYRFWAWTIPEANRYTRRRIWWHDLGETLSAMSDAFHAQHPFSMRVDAMTTHFLHMVFRNLRIGVGVESARSLLARADRVTKASSALKENRGFEPFDIDRPGNRKLRETYTGAIGQYLQDVEKLRETGTGDFDIRKHHEGAMIAEQVARIEARELMPVYLIPPVTDPSYRAKIDSIRTIAPALIAFNDPDRYPDLFLPDWHTDHLHLNSHGAHQYSRLVARELAQYLDISVPR
jgi:hypothetical protein